MIFGAKPNMDVVCWRSHSTARPFRSAQCWSAILNFHSSSPSPSISAFGADQQFDMTEALLAKTKLAEQKEAGERPLKEPSAEEQTVQLLQRVVTSCPSRTRPATRLRFVVPSPIDLMIPITAGMQAAVCGLRAIASVGCGRQEAEYEKGFRLLGSLQFCGAKGIRTPDPLHAMEMRYQLRHSPVELAGFEPATLCLQSRCATSCAIAP